MLGRFQSSMMISGEAPPANAASSAAPSGKAVTSKPWSVSSPSPPHGNRRRPRRRRPGSDAPRRHQRISAGTGLELGQAETSSFIGVVIALHLVRKCSELLGLDVRIELDVQRASAVAVAPALARRLVFLAVGRAEQSPKLALALAGELPSPAAAAGAGPGPGAALEPRTRRGSPRRSRRSEVGRGRLTRRLGGGGWAAACGEVRRARSLRMLCAVSQADNSRSPTVCSASSGSDGRPAFPRTQPEGRARRSCSGGPGPEWARLRAAVFNAIPLPMVAPCVLPPKNHRAHRPPRAPRSIPHMLSRWPRLASLGRPPVAGSPKDHRCTQ